MFDVIIKNGKIADGSGNPWFCGDLGVKDGRIARIGLLSEETAAETIDAAGCVIAPGFIDIHCHSDAVIFAQPREKGKILQGVTTEVIGNCGSSAAPTNEATIGSLQQYLAPLFGSYPLAWDWQSVKGYLARVEENGMISNVASLVGHGTVRVAVMDFDNRKPTAEELRKMQELVGEALDEGAFGLSSGLIYPPGLFSDTSEMAALCGVVAKKGGFYATHIRDESAGVEEAVAEAIAVARKTGVAVEISHHKAAGRSNWGKTEETLQLIDAAREEGLDVTCDVYPYIASSTSLGTLLPPWMHEGGVGALLERLQQPAVQERIKKDFGTGLPGWENYPAAAGWNGIMVSYCENHAEYEGKTLQEIAADNHMDGADALFKILLQAKANALMNVFSMNEEDVKRVLRHPASMVGSDAIPSEGKPHPRFFGTFARVLGKYVRDEKLMRLEEGVRKMTAMPAQRLGIRDRGLVREGLCADIVVFDPNTVCDKSIFANPQQYPEGIKYVLVNGCVAVRQGEYTGVLAGKVLRKGR